MAGTKVGARSVRMNDGRWMCRVWNSLRLTLAETFGGPVRPEGYGKRLNPILELDRINGKLVLMGRNQTMRLLLQAPFAESQGAMSGLRLGLGRR